MDRSVLKSSFMHFVVLAGLLIGLFSMQEGDDTDTVMLAIFLYLPFVIVLTVVNMILLLIGLHLAKVKAYRWLTALLTPAALVIWYLASEGGIEIYYWEMNDAEFVWLNLTIIAMNLVTIRIATK